MRRVLVAVVVTVAGLVALLSFKTHMNSSERTVGSPPSVPPLLPGEHALTGRAVRTVYGPVQVRVVERSRTIVGVNILAAPGRDHDGYPDWPVRLPPVGGRDFGRAKCENRFCIGGHIYEQRVHFFSAECTRQSGLTGGACFLPFRCYRRRPSVTARVRHAEPVMGTVVSFDVPAAAVVGGSLEAAVRWLHWVDRIFSPYRPDSDVSLLAAAEVTVDGCAPEVAEVISACTAVRLCSGGYFTAAPGGVFDPSGYVKGWAVERAAAILSAAGSASHLVNGGGDVQCVGGRPRSALGGARRVRVVVRAVGWAARRGAVAGGHRRPVPPRPPRPRRRGGRQRGRHLRHRRTRRAHHRPAPRPPGHRPGQPHRGRPVPRPRRRLRHRRLRHGPGPGPRLDRIPAGLRGLRDHRGRRHLADQPASPRTSPPPDPA